MRVQASKWVCAVGTALGITGKTGKTCKQWKMSRCEATAGKRWCSWLATHLNSSAVGDGLVGVDALVGLLAVEEVPQEILHLGDTGGATHKDDLVDVCLLQVGIIQCLQGAQQSCQVRSKWMTGRSCRHDKQLHSP
jgi:hypothetical protein